MLERALVRCALVLACSACRSPVQAPASSSTSDGATGAAASAQGGSHEGAGPASPAAPRSASGGAVSPGQTAPQPSWASSALGDSRFQELITREGRYVVCWRPLSEEIPRNEDFALEVRVFAQGRPLSGAHLTVSARMPEHNHGMLRAPRTLDRGDGSYRVEGMLLHMRGRWVLLFDVLHGSQADVAECSLELR